MPQSIRPGDELAGRYRLVDLLSESGGGRFWRAHDRVLERHVALHVIASADPRADALLAAARRSAVVLDRRILRVLDAERVGEVCYVVNEWGTGTSLDISLANNGPLSPRRAAWVVGEVAESIAGAHAHGTAHGRLAPENVLLDHRGEVRIIGFCVDAALHGLPVADPASDVRDLGGLLYAALTGRWAGASPSAVPPAPSAHGRVLRPRQVRAGVPRPLDDLCDALLEPVTHRSRETRDGRDLRSAAAACAVLQDFVGDPTGLPEAIAAAHPATVEPVNLPAVPEVPVREPDPEPRVAPRAEADDAPEIVAAPEPELPTEAGLPIFDDESDEVSWFTARAGTPPPPPPFEEPPERPLFAPEPEDGTPVRRARPPRPGDTTAVPVGAGLASPPRPRGPGGPGTPGDYWPWDADRTAGSGLLPVVEDDVPGRSWLRLALAIAGALLLLVAIVLAYNLGRGRTVLGEARDEDPTTPAAPSSSAPPPTATPLEGLVATDLDPFGDPPQENPDLAGLAVDGDPATAWRTETYEQDLGPLGLKTGVGLSVDLGAVTTLEQVDLRLVGEPTTVQLYLTDEPLTRAPTDVEGLAPVAEQAAGAQTELVLEEPATGRHLVVWLTSLPPVEGGFRAEVGEVVALALPEEP